jgi:hypothetical protein
MNCKPGDLAIVTHARRTENIGKIVLVIGRAKDDETAGPAWQIHAERIQNVVFSQTGLPAIRNPKLPLHQPDAWLKPVSGIPVGEDVRDEMVA